MSARTRTQGLRWLPLRTEFALEPSLRVCAPHWVRLTAVHAAHFAPARFLHEHKPHGPVAHRTGWQTWLDLGHGARLWSGGSAKLSVTGNSRRRAVIETPCASKFRSRWSILLTYINFTLRVGRQPRRPLSVREHCRTGGLGNMEIANAPLFF
jgi:hypothetical protein